jgi:uncharacterized protein with ParB-like and HNH nuclease domain
MDEFDPALLEERVDLGCFVKILGKPEKKDGKEFQLKVPTFQRPYIWSETLVESFTKRLFKAFENKEKYFASTVFLHLDLVKTEALVLDGLQRLTTLSLIIMVLIDQLTDEDVTKELMKQLTNDGKTRLIFQDYIQQIVSF